MLLRPALLLLAASLGANTCNALPAPDAGAPIAPYSSLQMPRAQDLAASCEKRDSLAPARGEVWWPLERMPVREEFASLTEHQMVFFRRPCNVLAVIATQFDDADAELRDRFAMESAPLLLVRSPRPDSGEIISTSGMATDGRLAIVGVIPSQPALLGVEMHVPTPHAMSARLRTGVEPPPPLAELPPGSIALSAPALFRVVGADLPNTVAALLTKLMPTTRIRKGASVGLFWETYGIPKGDSVSFAVTITRTTGRSLLERVGRAVLRRPLPPGELSVGWQTQDTPNAAPVLGVPIVARSITLNLRELRPGSYVLSIEAVSGSREAVSETRLFTIER